MGQTIIASQNQETSMRKAALIAGLGVLIMALTVPVVEFYIFPKLIDYKNATQEIEEIYSKTEKNISSNGVLTYPTLRLFALDKNGDGISGAGTGDFFISVNNNQLVIENNNLSRYFISGATQQAIFNIITY